ncbi:hypothetical protein ACFQ60_05415 [Streptomyces zhihengii]
MTEAHPLSDLGWTRGYTDPAWIRRFTSAGRELTDPPRLAGRRRPRDLPAGGDGSGLDTVPSPRRRRHGHPAGALRRRADGRLPRTAPGLRRVRAVPARHRGAHPALQRLGGEVLARPRGGGPGTPGLLDREAPTTAYVPELAGTAFGEARIQDLLHMGTQVAYGRRPFDKSIEAQRYFAVIAPGCALSTTTAPPPSASTC